MRGIDCVSTGDVDCEGRTLKLVKAKLRASEAEVARLTRELEGSKAAHASVFNKMQRQTENIAGLNSTLLKTQRTVIALRQEMERLRSYVHL